MIVCKSPGRWDAMIHARSAFRHEHQVAVGEGGTLYTDRVTYAAMGGAPLEWLLVNAYMRRIFQARHRNMLRLLS